MKPSIQLLKNIEANIGYKGDMVEEYADFILMEHWKCTPKEYEEQDEYQICLAKQIINMQRKHEYLESKRNKQ